MAEGSNEDNSAAPNADGNKIAAQTPAEVAEKCLAEIEYAQSDEDYKTFIADGEQGYKFYKNATTSFTTTTNDLGRVIFNPLYSNVQILMPLYYARMPKLIGKRRFQDAGKRGRLASKILERCVAYSLDMESDNFNQAAKMSIKDMIITGRGNSRVYFSAQFEDAIDSQGKPYRKPIPFTEKATTGYVYWKDYLTNKARNASEHRWRGHCAYMTREELIKEFGTAIGSQVPLDDGKADKSSQDQKKKDYVGKAQVWEKWRIVDKRVYWVAPSYTEQPLKSAEDPLRLEGFFPYPRPLTGTTSTDSDIPTGQYKIDKGLLEELRDTCQNIAEIQAILRVVGWHDKALHDDIIKLRTLRQGQTTPVNFPQDRSGKLVDAIQWFPFEKAAEVLAKLIEYAEWIIGKLWQQDGIPDIVRGASDPNETLGAQQLKSNFTVIRVADIQADIQRWLKDLLNMKAQIIFDPALFSDEMIAMMCGYESMTDEEKMDYPSELALLRDDRLRTFYIDIETDSTIAADEEAEKTTAIEGLQNITQSFQTALEFMQVDPHVGVALLKQALYVVSRFRGARDAESALQRAIDAKEKDLNAQEAEKAAIEAGEIPPPEPPVDPEQLKAEAKQAIDAANQQLKELQTLREQDRKDFEAQRDTARKDWETQKDIEMKQAKLDADTLLSAKDMQLKDVQARHELLMQYLDMAKTDNERTAKQLKEERESKEKAQPKEQSSPNITVVLPSGKKMMSGRIDRATGQIIASSEDVQ